MEEEIFEMDDFKTPEFRRDTPINFVEPIEPPIPLRMRKKRLRRVPTMRFGVLEPQVQVIGFEISEHFVDK